MKALMILLLTGFLLLEGGKVSLEYAFLVQEFVTKSPGGHPSRRDTG